MIIGKGDIASVLQEYDRPDRLYFASGVSNSSELREAEFQREKDLLLSQDRWRHLVYFSSLSILYKESRYTIHKREMEALVKETFKGYTIMRLGNICWGSNPNTIINFLRNKIARGEPYEIQDVYRYVIDRTEFLHWISLIPPWNTEMNVPGRIMTVRQIVREFCQPEHREVLGEKCQA